MGGAFFLSHFMRSVTHFPFQGARMFFAPLQFFFLSLAVVNPDAASLYAKAPFMQYIPLAFKAMTSHGAHAPVFSLGVCYFFNKGLAF